MGAHSYIIETDDYNTSYPEPPHYTTAVTAPEPPPAPYIAYGPSHDYPTAEGYENGPVYSKSPYVYNNGRASPGMYPYEGDIVREKSPGETAGPPGTPDTSPGEHLRAKYSAGIQGSVGLPRERQLSWPPLLCPFARRNPEKYRKVKTCAGPGWYDVHRVKEHIFRRHALRNSCGRCFERFSTVTKLREHQRAPTACPVVPPPTEGMCTDEQETQLRQREKNRHASEADKWRNVYRILFPGETVPSPYVDEEPVFQGNRSQFDLGKEIGPENKLRLDLGELVDGQPPPGGVPDLARTIHDPDFYFPPHLFGEGESVFDTGGLLGSASHEVYDICPTTPVWIPDALSSPHLPGESSFPPAVDGHSERPMPIVSNDDIDQPRAIARQPPTMYEDSGYGSLGAKSVAQGLGKLDAIQEHAEPAQTESDRSEESQDTRTVFSDAASLLQNPHVDMYIFAFAKELVMSMPPGFDAHSMGAVPSTLDRLLKSFAVRLGNESPDRPQRQLMYLVYRFRSEIIKRMERMFQAQDDADLESASGTDGSGGSSVNGNPGMTLDEKMRLMWDKESKPLDADNHGRLDGDHATLDDLDEIDDLDSFDESEIPELSKYREILAESPAYQWLQSALRVQGSLQVPEPNAKAAYHHIADQIIKAACGTAKFSRRQVREFSMVLIVDWHPTLFAQEQEYDAPLSCVLAQAITLTGYGNNLQAATCESYLQQTWPESGPQLLSLLQKAIEGGPYTATLRDKTRLSANFMECRLHLDITGSVFSVAEIAEQIAWIGAALRSSPSDADAVYSTAQVANLRCYTDPGATHTADRIITVGECMIEFKTEILLDADLAKAGKCWRGMFGNPVIVRGYPIPCRAEAEADAGLDIPLDMAAALTNCRRAVNFAGTTFLKGFAAMLTAVRVVGGVVFWHLYYNPGGEYLSYEDNRVYRVNESQTLSIEALERARHIVGWSDNVRNYAGAPDADYGINWTDLPGPGSSCVLEKVTLSASAIPCIAPGGSFLIGVKDKPLHLGFGTGDDYMGTLMTIGRRHFVFYDSEERRAWLIDGVSAVVHLLRAYLKFYVEDNRLGEYFMYSDGDIEEPRPGVAYTGAKAAYEVLTNPNNQNLPLYPKNSVETEQKTRKLGSKLDADLTTFTTTSSNLTLRERIEQICHVLLQATAYHDDLSRQAGFGWRIKASPRHHIEGFEFMDVATRHDTLWPKVATIQAISVGWVHLVRSLHAVTLFGAGFGELFRPVRGENQPHACCSATSYVPTGKDLLAVYGADLQDMLRTGSQRRNPWRLADNVHWHSPDGVAFETCKCIENNATKQSQDCLEAGHDGVGTKPSQQKMGLRGLLGRYGDNNKPDQPPNISDRVQVLLPASFPQLYGRGLRSPARVVTKGAVVFGHSWKFPLRWSLTKDVPPVEGEPDPPSLVDVSGLMSDSGIGTSVESSDSGPTPPSSSLYSLGSNPGFFRRGSPESLRSVPQDGLDISPGGEKAAGQTVVLPPQSDSRKRSAISLESEGSSSASKVRRVDTGSPP